MCGHELQFGQLYGCTPIVTGHPFAFCAHWTSVLLQPFRLWYNAPSTLALGVGMLAPLAFTALSGQRYTGA